jgi:hypothetical protein
MPKIGGMSIGMPDFGMIGGGIADFGAAAGALITQQGDYRAAEQYTEAGNIASENVRLARASGQIQKLQEEHELFRSESGTVAAAGGAGLSTSGSMRDILRSSAAQGALRIALTGAQTEINANAYNQQATAFYAESSQATAQGNAQGAKASSDTLGGIASFVGAAASMIAFV